MCTHATAFPKKRTCTARLQKRRNSTHSHKQKGSLKPATPSSRLSSLSSISDAAAAAAKAGPRKERDTLPSNACSWDLQVGPVGGAAATQEPAAAAPGCSAHEVAHQEQWQQQPVEAAGSSGSPTAGPWAPYAAAASPMASGPQCTGSGSSLLTCTQQQLAPSSSTAAPAASSMCWGPPAAAGASIEPLLPPEDEDLIMQCLDDAASLQIMLESELTAAALGAAIVTSSSHQQQALVDVERRRISQHLAAVLVQDSGLFGEPAGAACTPAGVLGGLDSSQPPQMMLQPQGTTQYCLPAVGVAPQQPAALYSQDSVIGSNIDGWGCVSNSGAFPAGKFPTACSPAAGSVWGYQAMCPGLQAPPLMSYGFAAPAWSSTAGPLGSMGVVAPAKPPADPGPMHCSPGVFTAGCGGQLPPATAAAAVPVKVEPGLPATNTLLGAAGAAVCWDGKSERVQQLQQEMCHLHHQVASLRCQLGL